MDSTHWNDRSTTVEKVWKADSNIFQAVEARTLPTGRALDVACGEGRNAGEGSPNRAGRSPASPSSTWASTKAAARGPATRRWPFTLHPVAGIEATSSAL